MDEHLASFPRHGEGGLAFEIEMLLTADAQQPRELVGRLRDGLRRLAHPEIVIGQDLRIRRQRILDGEDGRLLLDLHMGQSCGATRLIAGLGDHHEDHLAPKDHGAIGDQGIVVEGVGGVVVAGHIRRRQHGDHARGGPHLGEIKRLDASARGGGEAGGQMQRALGLADVVDIGRCAAHMQER